jgi:hypothetical protein
MRKSLLISLGAVVVLASLAGGCKKGPPAPTAATTSSAPTSGTTSPPPTAPTSTGITGKKYYTTITSDQWNRAGSAEIQTEQQVVAILGEPTERSATRTFTNKRGTFTEYDLLWLKPDGKPIAKVVFLNNRKTGVFADVK